MEVAEERVLLPDGREVDGFLSVGTRDFAAIVAITDRAEVVLIRSYKHGPRSISLAVPAGYLEEGEDALAAARRELRDRIAQHIDVAIHLRILHDRKLRIDLLTVLGAEVLFLLRGRRSADSSSMATTASRQRTSSSRTVRAGRPTRRPAISKTSR